MALNLVKSFYMLLSVANSTKWGKGMQKEEQEEKEAVRFLSSIQGRLRGTGGELEELS